MRILLSWIGATDLTCAENDEPDNLGPVAQALAADQFDQALLLNNYPEERVAHFKEWIQRKCGISPEIRQVDLSSPTAHSEIYSATRNIVRELQQREPDAALTFHISPGTPAMALCWFLLAPVFGARLIESSRQYGIRQVNFPFEISAYFLPDRELEQLAFSSAPVHAAFQDILFACEAMRSAVVRAQHAAARDVTVLIEGESGTGKELFARAIHDASSRAQQGQFVPVNCGAVPETLIESEFFGHRKGSFTGADRDKEGFFLKAHDGTLFLDEVGELSPKAQTALLRVIQDRAVTRVGDTKAQKVNVRIVAATNRDLIHEVAAGRFREDLFYRLAVACLKLPPLRERGDKDIDLLLDAALDAANKRPATQGQTEGKQFSDSAKKIMMRHSWPGNVRELYNTVMRAVLWTPGSLIDEEEARKSLFSWPEESQNILERPLDEDFNLKELLDEVSRHYLKRAMLQAGGVKSRAAELLGFNSYQTLSNWMKRYEGN